MADITVDEFTVYLKNRKEASGLNLSGLDLSNMLIRDLNLRGANLSYCDLSRSDLSGSDLTRANLRGANLDKAILRNTVFVKSKQDLKKSKLLLIKYFLNTTKLVFGCLGIKPVEEM